MQRRISLALLIVCLIVGATGFVTFSSLPAHAVLPDEMLKDQALEHRARDLSRELRCLVCQNESIDDSAAPLARDLRLLLRERLKAGDTDQQVLDYLVARYGEFVLLKPRLSMHTVLLWGTPPILLVLGGIVLLFAVRRRRQADGMRESQRPLTGAEQERVSQLVGTESHL
jgi:cytochrome c-type biogenesis protein CcmH